MIVNPFCTAATVLTEACDFPSHENKHSWQKKSHPKLYSQREEGHSSVSRQKPGVVQQSQENSRAAAEPRNRWRDCQQQHKKRNSADADRLCGWVQGKREYRRWKLLFGHRHTPPLHNRSRRRSPHILRRRLQRPPSSTCEAWGPHSQHPLQQHSFYLSQEGIQNRRRRRRRRARRRRSSFLSTPPAEVERKKESEGNDHKP